MTGEAFLDTGHGTGIDTSTLTGVIHDQEAFDRWGRESSDPVLSVIGPLFRGDLDTAEAELRRIRPDAAPGVQFRLAALAADILRDRGDFAQAADGYRALLAQYAGTSRESVLRQHLGKVFFAAGDYPAARDHFAVALQLRRDQSAPADQIDSSRLAIDRAEEEISRAATSDEPSSAAVRSGSARTDRDVTRCSVSVPRSGAG